MKILQVIPYFYPAWRFGGPFRVAYDISRSIDTADIQDENTRACRVLLGNRPVRIIQSANLSIENSRVRSFPRSIFIRGQLISSLLAQIHAGSRNNLKRAWSLAYHW